MQVSTLVQSLAFSLNAVCLLDDLLHPARCLRDAPVKLLHLLLRQHHRFKQTHGKQRKKARPLIKEAEFQQRSLALVFAIECVRSNALPTLAGGGSLADQS